MKQVPITRFKREVRKWTRREESVEITRRGKVVLVYVPIKIYNTLLDQIKNNC